jgi:ribose transport system substrate-binding protein
VIPEAGGKLVGVSLRTRRTWLSRELEAGLTLMASRVSMRLDIQCAEMGVAAQSQQIAEFVGKGVAAIIVSPVDSAHIGPALRKATDAGIPVITLEGRAPGAIVNVTCHVGSDDAAGGRLAAIELARLTGAKGQVVVLDDPGPSSSADRLRGFQGALGKHPGMKVLATRAAGGDRAAAKRITASLLKAYPEVRGVFALNDELALGANDACLDPHGRKVAVVGYDGSPEATQAIVKGQPLQADIAQAGQIMAARAVEMTVRSLAHESVKQELSLAPSVVDRAVLGKKNEGPPVT